MRYQLCTLKEENSETTKTAYIKSIDAKVGNKITIDNEIWEIKDVSLLSVPEQTLKSYQTASKTNYKKI